MMGQKCFVTLKMHKQLYKEHLSLQKSFCALYRHMSENYNPKQASGWLQEKKRLEATIKHLKSKALQLQRKLEDSNERCELLEFCLLELENQTKVPGSDEFLDKSVNTELWGKNILKKCVDTTCCLCLPADLNTNEDVTSTGKLKSSAEMDSEPYRVQLEETQMKLFSLSKQLDSVLKCNSKLGVGMDYVIATVNELQSLMDWTSGKKELKADSSVIFQKLQQLERIQKELEKTASESEQIRCHAQQQETRTPSPEEPEGNVPESVDENDESFTDNEKKSIKHVLFIETNFQSLEADCTPDSPDSVNIIDNPMIVDLDTSEDQNSNFDVDNINNSSDHNCVCSSGKEGNEDANDQLDSLGPSISEDEGLGEESRRGDSTGPNSFIGIQDIVSDIAELDSIQSSPEKGTITIKPEVLQKTVGWIGDLRDPRNSLELCMCAIGNLKESLRAKENELLKLSAIQNDQKQITALQDVIINFHKDTAQLKTQLEATKMENSSLKEQVLELEEAENDARLQAQRLGEKLLFLQEKDSHFQAELVETKQALEKCIDELTVKEMEERELRSQLKYVEALVQKYEDQIHTMEVVEFALRKKLIEQEEDLKLLENSIAESEREKYERGTQTYPISKIAKLVDNCLPETEHADVTLLDDGIQDVKVVSQVPNTTSFSQILRVDCSAQTENDLFSNLDIESLTTKHTEFSKTEASSEDSESVALSTIECPIQKELLKRLHQLVEEDADLQQQLHHVDQINLTLWKKLHSLEFHIGECKKQNMSDDYGSDSCLDSESCDLPSICSRPVSREQMREDSLGTSKCGSPCSNKGIIACLDHSEQEIKDRLMKLERINASFEKELEMREQMYVEKERKYGEWVQTEQCLIGDLKRLEDERDSLSDQVTKLENEKLELASRVCQLEEELSAANEKHCSETTRIKTEQEEVMLKFQKTVDLLHAKEKEHLKQITNLKIEKTKSSDKTESEKLKSSYVQLQIELSHTRDKMRAMEEEFRSRLEEARRHHTMEEVRLLSEIEMLRSKNLDCDGMITSYQARHGELMSILKQKESELEQARLEYKKNMEATEEEHRTIEAQLKNQLRQMEEGTAVATRALTEERVRLEKELQENIDDLRSKEELYKARIAELETNVSHLHEELHRITGDLDSGFDSEVNHDSIGSFRREKLMNELRELRDREGELREKLDEMEQKEAAYRETLEHADRIVASVEQGYKNKIEELEISEKNLKQRVGHLEEVESRLRGALHKERRSSDGRKPDDLVLELMEAEVRETGLKEKVDNLEQLQRNNMSKVKDLEKLREKLEAQLSDKDEIASTLKRTQQELELARKTLFKLKKSESDLQTSLHQTEGVLSTTENQMRTKIRSMEEEKKGLEETINELRDQVRELKKKLEKRHEDDNESMSVALQNQGTSSSSAQQKQNEEMEDIDYAEVDDGDCLSNVPNAKDTKIDSIISNKKFPSEKFPSEKPTEKKIVPLSFSPFSSSQMSYKNKETVKSPPTSCQEIILKKEVGPFHSKTPTPQISDSYDDARQNLEDCMMRAIGAMTMDLEKSKKLSKVQAESYNRSISSDVGRISHQVPSNRSTTEENDYDEILPRPTNFRVVQQVGSDTLLVGWEYVNTSVLEGFEVYVDGHLHETVYTPDRTKALISGLNLTIPLRLSICALSRCGQMSDPEILQLPSPQERNSGFFFNDDEDEDDEDGLFDDAVFEKQRPYSMEW